MMDDSTRYAIGVRIQRLEEWEENLEGRIPRHLEDKNWSALESVASCLRHIVCKLGELRWVLGLENKVEGD